MKYLLILFVSFNSFAGPIITVAKKEGSKKIRYKGIFDGVIKCTTYQTNNVIEGCIYNEGLFGKNTKLSYQEYLDKHVINAKVLYLEYDEARNNFLIYFKRN